MYYMYVWHWFCNNKLNFLFTNRLEFMFEIYYWGRREPITRTNIITVEHCFVNMCIRLRKSPILHLWWAEHVNSAGQAWKCFLVIFTETGSSWIVALLVFWLKTLNVDSCLTISDNRWHSDLLRRGPCPRTDDTHMPLRSPSSSVRRPHCEETRVVPSVRPKCVCSAQCCLVVVVLRCVVW